MRHRRPTPEVLIPLPVLVLLTLAIILCFMAIVFFAFPDDIGAQAPVAATTKGALYAYTTAR